MWNSYSACLTVLVRLDYRLGGGHRSFQGTVADNRWYSSLPQALAFFHLKSFFFIFHKLIIFRPMFYPFSIPCSLLSKWYGEVANKIGALWYRVCDCVNLGLKLWTSFYHRALGGNWRRYLVVQRGYVPVGCYAFPGMIVIGLRMWVESAIAQDASMLSLLCPRPVLYGRC